MEKVDLSKLSAAALTNWLFDRPPTTDDPDAESWLDGYSYYKTDHPQELLANLTAIFTDFAAIGPRFTRRQLDGGIWVIFGGAGPETGKYFANPSIPLPCRIACIDSMYLVFREFVATLQPPWVENCYYMWWDLVCTSFWNEVRHHSSTFTPPQTAAEARELLDKLAALANLDIDKSWKNLGPHEQELRQLQADDARAARAVEDFTTVLSADQFTVLDAMFSTLGRILSIDNRACQGTALHGLGHLHHPKVKTLVQRYMEESAHLWAPNDRQWLEACRDGTVL